MQLLRSACTQLLLLEQLTLKVSTTPIYPEYFRPHQSPTQPRKFTPPKDSGTTISSRQRQPTFSKMRHWRAQSVDTSSSFLQKCQQSAMSPRSTRRKRPSKWRSQAMEAQSREAHGRWQRWWLSSLMTPRGNLSQTPLYHRSPTVTRLASKSRYLPVLRTSTECLDYRRSIRSAPGGSSWRAGGTREARVTGQPMPRPRTRPARPALQPASFIHSHFQ